jgi:hypothetical protein
MAVVSQGTYSSVPSSPGTGDRHLCTDCPYVRIYDGSTWLDWLDCYGLATAPANVTWSATSGSVGNTGAGKRPPLISSAFIYTDEPGTTDYTVRLITSFEGGTRQHVGFYDTASGKATTIFRNQSANNWGYTRWNTLGGAVASEAAAISNSFEPISGPYTFWELSLASGTMTFKAGDSFYRMGTIHTEAVATHITTIDSICVGFGSTTHTPTLWHYEVV